MKKFFGQLLLAVAAVALFASCDNPAKMAEAAEKININCTPEVLEVVAGNIDATVDVTFPGEYFHPKAILEVTPVILYHGGEVAGEPFYYQGEKVKDNYKVIAKKEITTVREKVNFAYIPGMERSELVLRAKVIYKSQEYEYPADIKVADGANTTYMLAKSILAQGGGVASYLSDEYQAIIPETTEAQILYLINSADVRNSELKNSGIKDYQKALENLAADSRRTIKGTEIVAYASPEGEIAHNNKLSANREKSAAKALGTITKKLETGEVTSRSIGEDWEGFQDLVSNSNIEDKELILRVLSMYSDPNVREREIKNMSQIYTSLAKEVLPELRRARFITNVEYANYTDAELRELLANNVDGLDEEALLYTATLVDGTDTKLSIYDQAIKKFNSERAKYNAALTAFKDGRMAKAQEYINKLNDQNLKDVKNLKGLLALAGDDSATAAKLFTESGVTENLAVVDILNGNYQGALSKLQGKSGENAALANILNGNLAGAENALKNATGDVASYLKAIVAARKGDANTVRNLLEKISDKALKERAADDIEFLKLLQ